MGSFFLAAFPWIVMGLFVAGVCSMMNRKKKEEK